MSGRAGVVAVTLLALAAGGGCDRLKGLVGDAPDEKRAALGESVGGLEATGAGPVLGWEAVPGAARYAVSVSDGTGVRWAWLGTQTKVRYGAASAGDPDMPSLGRMQAPVVVAARPGATYRWFVTALDARGRLLAHSPMQSFVATEKTAPPAPGRGVASRRRAGPDVAPPPAIAAEPATPPPSAAPASLLTEAKVRGFIVYQREISGAGGDAIAAFGPAAARAKGGPGGMGPSAATDRLAARSEAALRKSGLTQEEVTALSGILTPYYSKRVRARDAQKALAQSKSGGVMDSMYRKRLADAEQARTDFSRTYGAASLAAVERHEAEYHVIAQAMVDSVLRPRR
ncbi:MAG TPA: hypothetical protein VGQ83_03200 [Polyangia bacterium]|jgi:hypothetical protein